MLIVGMGISPDIWGPHAWAFIHLMILAEKEPFDKGRLPFYHNYFELLTQLLPCEKCRLHLQDNLKKLKPLSEIQTKEDLFAWSVELHNLVNESHGKPRYPFEEMYNYWKDISTGKKTMNTTVSKKNIYKWISVVLFIIVILFIIDKVRRKK